jgi:hypothetical protein
MLRPSRHQEAVLSQLRCPHCGLSHDAGIAFCPTSGQAIGPETSPPPAAGAGAAMPDKGVADLLSEAWVLYRQHARALLMTCALLFVPASLIKSCAVAAIMAPSVAAASSLASDTTHELEALDRARHELQDAYKNRADADTIRRLQAEQNHRAEELARRGIAAASAAMGSFTLFILGLLGTLVTFFFFGMTVPLTNGALTIAIADRVLGGQAGWREVWMLLFRRLGLLLTAVIPAAVLIAFGCVFFVIPGLVLAVLFSFVSPVVLIEGVGGREALRRSTALVRSDWLRVAIMLVVFGVLRGVAQMVASMLFPQSALFGASFFSDLVTLAFLPLPVLGMVLLYFDIRRKRENFTDDRLRADLEALKTA